MLRYCKPMTALERTLRLSRFAARVAQARPEELRTLEERGAAPFGRQEMRTALEGATADDIGARLRQLRRRVLFTLAHRDLNGLAPLDEVVTTMTALAERCIETAAVHAHRIAAARYGEPRDFAGEPQRLIVAALGKLGGEELNVSSDIDLVFLYSEDGETDSARPISHHEFFAHAGRALIALLWESTDEGQAFRVDMRLRPFGDGPLATSLGAFEEYLVTHARPWERYAWLKARVIAGPAEGVQALVEPFVYRRYLDYGLLGALRELHGRIFETAIQRRKADDIKVGAGGIREIEFAVQLFQLVRGGRDRGLRLTSTRTALAALAERGLIAAPRAHALGEAYTFLRRLEHRLQYYDDQQTQALPVNDEHRALIAEAMDCRDWTTLDEALARHRAAVQEAFNALFEGAPRSTNAVAAAIAAWLNDPQAAPDAAGLAEDLAEAGLAAAHPAAEHLIEFTRARRYRSMSATMRAKVDALLPSVVAASVEAGRGLNEAVTLGRLLQILEAIDRREAYVALLIEYPQVLARAARLVSRSAWAARLLARHPILLDELTRTTASFTATDWHEERDALLAECVALVDDLELQLEELRHFKQRHMLRLTIADVEGELAVMALSDELSALADTLLDVTLSLASSPRGFAIVGYGKLGGKE